ncbi:metallophosphoesterase [Bacteroidota bacterium]
MRRFVLGDMHGAYRALIQCLSRSGFNYTKDLLIFLGDICDGWSEVTECVEELLKIKNLIYLKGNHDLWLSSYLETGEETYTWLVQGGIITKGSYMKAPEMKNKHLEFLQRGIAYYIDDDGKLFVHAGFNPDKPVDETDDPEQDYYWSREIYRASFSGPVQPEKYHEIFVGHTPIGGISNKPLKNHNIWLMDTGAGWRGNLSIMDIDSKELFQSDPVEDLYPTEPGRQGLRDLITSGEIKL